MVGRPGGGQKMGNVCGKDSQIIGWKALYILSASDWSNKIQILEAKISTVHDFLIFEALEPCIYFKVPKHYKRYETNHGNILETYYFGNYENFWNPKCCHFSKRRAPKNDEDPSNIFLKILNKYLPQNMTWFFWNIYDLFEILKFGNFET